MQGEIIEGVGGLYKVLLSDGRTLTCRARGKFRHEKIILTIGDDVLLEADNGRENEYVISEILPRRNRLIRPPVSNITHMIVAVPTAAPNPDLFTVDKLIAIAEYNNIKLAVAINKADLAEEKATELANIYRAFPTFVISAKNKSGLAPLISYMSSEGKTSPSRFIFAGASGAGKSTMINSLFPTMRQATGEISQKTERGKHTTRKVEIHSVQLEGVSFEIADTPGFSMLDFTSFDFFPREALPHTFREIDEKLGKCRYTKCTHTVEDGCAVLSGVASGDIAPTRHESYVSLYRELKNKPRK